MFKHHLAVFIAVLFPFAAIVAQNAPQRTDVPVRTVMLFSSGVGYFEHAGTVRGEGSTELRFKTSQINDILKSLVLQDRDGGRVRTVTYASQDPVEKTLRSFQVDITANPGLAALLNQLRGARVTVQAQGERMSRRDPRRRVANEAHCRRRADRNAGAEPPRRCDDSRNRASVGDEPYTR